jgi:hypothetical protein
MFVQRQYGLKCGLHAANNAVGHRLLIAADLNHEADELAREMALSTQETQRRRSTGSPEEPAVLQKRMRALLNAPAGGGRGRRTASSARSPSGASTFTVARRSSSRSWGIGFSLATSSTSRTRRTHTLFRFAAARGSTRRPPSPVLSWTKGW